MKQIALFTALAGAFFSFSGSSAMAQVRGPYGPPPGAYVEPDVEDDGEAPPQPYRRGVYTQPPVSPGAALPFEEDLAAPPRGAAEPLMRAPRSELDLEINTQETTRRLVRDPTGLTPGTIYIDTATRHLYLVQPGGTAFEYGIGVGRQGFEWKGAATIGRKAEWPNWTPPTAMLKRRPDLPSHMVGGIDNPLGARALYLYQGSRDTLFRIHGTNEPDTIGQAVSSGCIRMMNADVIDLHRRVGIGARVVVR